MVLAVLAAINPVGLSFLGSAFTSNEQLSRNIAQPIVFTAMALVAVAGGIEWWVRYRLL